MRKNLDTVWRQTSEEINAVHANRFFFLGGGGGLELNF